MKAVSLLILTAISGISLADIPDQTLEWDFFTVIEQPGAIEICDCNILDDACGFNLAVLSETDSKRELWLIELDSYGNVLRRTGLLPDVISQVEWVLPVFTDKSTIVIACGFNSEGRSSELRIADLSDPGVWRTVSLSSIFSDDVSVRISSIELSDPGELVLVGSSLACNGSSSLFAAAIDMEGRNIWQVKLLESQDYSHVSSTLEILDDGGCILMDSEYLPAAGGIPVTMIDSHAEVVWNNTIEMECTTGLSDLTEMDNGNIILSGSGRYDDQYAFRGIIVCLDPSGAEIWQREDWYLDHTAFVSSEFSAGSDLMLIGWAGIEGVSGFEVTDTDVLFAEVDASGESITGYLLEELGDQEPYCVFSIDEREYFVIGEHTAEGTEVSDLFLGRVAISRQVE